jgi:hypothetical protein
MSSLLLAVLVSCPSVAAFPDAGYPDAGPTPGGSSSHQSRHRLFGWLRGHHHDNKCPCAGNGHTGGNWQPVAPAAEVNSVEPIPPVVPPSCPCAVNSHAGGSWPPVAAAPVPAVVPPPATTEPAPRLVPSPQPVTTSAEPPLAAPPDGVSRPMPRGPLATTGAEPPRN